jgi:hypothetical protein
MAAARWTHTATLTRTYKVGPAQMYQFEDSNARKGTTVELFQDPAQQKGDLITIRVGHHTGVARLSDLTNITAR